MGEWKRKKQDWKNRNSRKLALEKQQKKKGTRSHSEEQVVRKNKHVEFYRALAPHEFSVISNPESTYDYFSKIVEEIQNRKFKEIFFFDLSEVEKISVDAIMYVLALMRNIKNKEVFKYTFKGNQPISEKANRLLMESGFFKYVSSNNPHIQTQGDNLQIVTGRSVDNDIAGNVCDFVNRKCNTPISFTDILYEVIIELMTNTVQHAYTEEKLLTVSQWYIYAGTVDDDIEFVFLDTGRGIPQTVNKKAIEKFGELFAAGKSDADYVVSALRGEWRTQTGENYRGRGLPCVIEYAKNAEVHSMTVVSGKAMVFLNGDEVEQKELDEKLFGTLYYWKIRKKEEFVDDKN